MPTVQIEGVGKVQFPDDMTPEQITAAIETDIIPNQQQPRTNTQEVGRQLGLTARAGLEGVADIAAIPANAVGGALNLGLGAIGVDYRFPEQGGAFSKMLTDMGLPVPGSDRERLVNTIGRRATGAAASMGTGSVLSQAPGVSGQVGASLASNPVLQGVGAATGPMAADIAKEAGAGPVGQTVADLAGSVAPAGVATGWSSGWRGAFRGGEEGRQRVQQNLNTFSRVGTTPTVGQATEGRVMRGAESVLSRAPGGAGQIVKKAEQQADELANAIEQRAAKLVKKTSAEQAGRQIQRSVSGEGGFIEHFKAQQEKLYDKLDAFFPKDKRVEVESTRKALKKLNQDIEGAEALSQWFKNARIKGIEEAFKKDTAAPDVDLSNPQLALQAAKTVKELDSIAERLKIGTWSEPTTAQKALEDSFFSIRQALASGKQQALQASDDIGRLPYEAVKKLRTLVGREIADSGLASDVPRSKWKALYAALSNDLGQAVEGNKPAKEVWSRANNFTKAGMRRIETIESVIDKNGGPEAVFRAATAGTKEGATTLRAVMQSVDNDGRKMISATVLRRLGLAKAGVQGELGDKFSTESFLTNWNMLSPEAKRSLFDRYGPTFRSDMDQVAKVAANLREGSQVFKNPSGTAQAATQYATAGAFAISVLTGQVGTAGTIATGVVGSNLLARLMRNPRFVRWLAKSTGMPKGAYVAAVNSLISQAKQTGDQDLAAAAELLKDQEQHRNDQGNGEDQRR